MKIVDILKILILGAILYFTAPLFTGIYNVSYYYIYILLILTLSGVGSHLIARGLIRLWSPEKPKTDRSGVNFAWMLVWAPLAAGLYQADKSVTWSSECHAYRILEERSYYQKTNRSRGRMIYYLHLENEEGPEKYYCAKREWDRYERGQMIELCRKRTLLGFIFLSKPK